MDRIHLCLKDGADIARVTACMRRMQFMVQFCGVAELMKTFTCDPLLVTASVVRLRSDRVLGQVHLVINWNSRRHLKEVRLSEERVGLS
jgi:hypothetical protein